MHKRAKISDRRMDQIARYLWFVPLLVLSLNVGVLTFSKMDRGSFVSILLIEERAREGLIYAGLLQAVLHSGYIELLTRVVLTKAAAPPHANSYYEVLVKEKVIADFTNTNPVVALRRTGAACRSVSAESICNRW